MRMSFISTVICFFTIAGVFIMSLPVKTEIKKSWRLLAVSESYAVSVSSSCSSCLNSWFGDLF